MLITILLAISWSAALIVGIALLGMMEYVGSRYVYTAEGVSRTGPDLGKTLSNITFRQQDTTLSLKDVISKTKPTLILFLNTNGELWRELMPDLLEFSQAVHDKLYVIVFCIGSTQKNKFLSSIESFTQIFSVDDQNDRLTSMLGIRVTPYGVLVDSQARVLAKGLVNNLTHLCLLLTLAALNAEDKSSVPSISMCSAIQEEIIAVSNDLRIQGV